MATVKSAMDVSRAAEKGRVAPVTVFVGEEPWFAEQAIRALRAAFLGDGEQEGYLSFRAPRSSSDREGTPLGVALDEGRTVPMFGGRQLLVWRGRSLSEGDAAALAAVGAASPAFARFAIVIGSLGKGDRKKLDAPGVTIAPCRKLFDTPWPGRSVYDTPLNRFAMERASRHGLSLDMRVAHVLTGAVGNDPGGIDATLGKLALLVGGGKRVEEEDLAPVLPGGRDFGSFAFGEAIYDRDPATAFRVARNAFREGVEDQSGHRVRDPVSVASRLLWSVGYRLDKVYQAGRLLAEGKSEEEVIGALSGAKRNPGAIRAVGQARKFSQKELLSHHLRLAAAEAATRSAVPAEVVIEALVPRLTGRSDG